MIKGSKGERDIWTKRGNGEALLESVAYVLLRQLLKSDDFQLETEDRTVHWPSSCLMIRSCMDSTPWSCVNKFIFL